MTKKRGFPVGKSGYPVADVNWSFHFLWRKLSGRLWSNEMVAWLVLALLLCKVPPAAAHTTVHVSGVVGSAVLLGADVPRGFQVREAIWRYLAPAEELVATYFRGSAETLYQCHFYGRSRLHSNLTLEIRQVELGDGGTFSALLVNTRGQTERRVLHLSVYEVVSQLALQVFTSESSRSGSATACEAFLTCVAASGTNVTYSWGRLDGEALTMDNHSLFEAGRVLWAKLGPSDRQMAYTCTAGNAVSQSTATITPWDHCQREAATDDAVYDYRNILLIAVPISVLLLAMAVCGLLLSRKHSGRQRMKSLSDVSEPDESPV
ncbi:LOW QUALITY PROTEIN: SLAM family member 8 [Carettochelys insculpta]|uniref:LOW QUALITY PROTEIN: SLAM family member 8 n=1 Tax=Carettochelys insculpta TaxID=44489 RepID=UPI003EB7881A